MVTYINGWTRESVEKHVRENFKGVSVEIFNRLNKSCKYRLPETDEKTGMTVVKKCIAGCFIPDDKYSEEMEGLSACIFYKRHVSSSTFTAPELETFMPLDPHNMIRWQSVHDNDLSKDMPLEQQISILLAFLDK